MQAALLMALQICLIKTGFASIGRQILAGKF